MPPTLHPSPLTRARRRRRTAIVVALIGTLIASIFWASASYRRGPGGSTLELGGPFGRYLTRTLPAGTTTPRYSLGGWALLGNLAVTAGLAGAGVLVTRHQVRRYRLVGGCDGCGYPFPADPGERCPECGEARDGPPR